MNEQISRHFPFLSQIQVAQISALKSLYTAWNEKINVISRKDIEHIEIHHILYSLSIALKFSFPAGTRIMDAGTGGGFPGIPLAILFPECEFTLVDSIAKKIKVVSSIKNELELKNVIPVCSRAEELHGQFDYILGRAVTSLPELFLLLRKKIKPDASKNPLPGMIYLKGGDFEEEIQGIPAETMIYQLSQTFDDPYFETKKIVYLFNFK